MNKTISPHLYEALKDWLAAATSDEPPEPVRRRGLCDWVQLRAPFGVIVELRDLMVWDMNDSGHPFNNHSDLDYMREQCKNENPLRLAWVRAKIADYEQEMTQ